MNRVGLFFAIFLFIGISFSKDTTVKYVHLAVTGNPTEMVVGWYTEDEVSTPIVSFGTFSKSYTHNTTGTTNQWKSGYGFNHFVTLTGLTPSTNYFYICGSENTNWSDQLEFTTAPSIQDEFTVAVYGDMGIDNSANTIKRVINQVNNGNVDLVYHVGDISYADDHIFTFQSTWNEFSQYVEPISSVVPYMVLPGNHEYESLNPLLKSSTKDFVVYRHRYQMPQANEKSQNMYYSFDYSYVHFISYSTETGFDGAPHNDTNLFGDMLSWLVADLEKANLPENRKLRPWIIVGGHRPIYSSASGFSEGGIPINHDHSPPSNSATLQKVFEDIFDKYGVDLIISGHVHSYERNYPAYKNKKTGGYVNPTSPMNIVIGNAGNIEGLENKDEKNWDQPAPEWSAYRFGDDYGYAMMTIHNGTHLTWNFYSAADDVLRDSFTLINENH